MKNKRVKQMICDVTESTKCCGGVYWESTSKRNCQAGYPNSILIVDGMNDIEYAFWYDPGIVSLTGDQLNGVKS